MFWVMGVASLEHCSTVLKRIEGKFPTLKEKEDAFVDAIRAFIAGRMETAAKSLPQTIKGSNSRKNKQNNNTSRNVNTLPQSDVLPTLTYDDPMWNVMASYQVLKGFDVTTFNLVLEEFPPWYRNVFRYPLPSLSEFLLKVAANMRLRDKWVGQMEYKFVEDTLNNCSSKIRIVVHTDRGGFPSTLEKYATTQNSQGQQLRIPILHLFNVGNRHYMYLVERTNSQIQAARRTIKTNTQNTNQKNT
jgi:hypothetical protein